MIAHLVMFRPRADLSDAQRGDLAASLTGVLRSVPAIRRTRVGKRITHGRAYEALMRADFPYLAILEFDDLAGLETYLDHPAHEQLASRFFEAFEEALMYDFDVRDGEAGIAALVSERAG